MGQGWVKWYACWSCIYQHKHSIHDYFCLHLQLPFNLHSGSRSHHHSLSFSLSHLFPFQPLLLTLSFPKPYSHFNVNSAYAYRLLNPPPSFSSAFLHIPEKKTHKRNMHMFMRPATQYVLRYLVKSNTFFFMGCTNFLFTSVYESYIPIWYYIYDAWQDLQFSISSAAYCK